MILENKIKCKSMETVTSCPPIDPLNELVPEPKEMVNRNGYELRFECPHYDLDHCRKKFEFYDWEHISGTEEKYRERKEKLRECAKECLRFHLYWECRGTSKHQFNHYVGVY